MVNETDGPRAVTVQRLPEQLRAVQLRDGDDEAGRAPERHEIDGVVYGPGDWVLSSADGKVTGVSADDFDSRFETVATADTPAEPAAAPTPDATNTTDDGAAAEREQLRRRLAELGG